MRNPSRYVVSGQGLKFERSCRSHQVFVSLPASRLHQQQHDIWRWLCQKSLYGFSRFFSENTRITDYNHSSIRHHWHRRYDSVEGLCIDILSTENIQVEVADGWIQSDSDEFLHRHFFLEFVFSADVVCALRRVALQDLSESLGGDAGHPANIKNPGQCRPGISER